MAFCLHYENVEDVFLHGWGAYQVKLPVPPTQYILPSDIRLEYFSTFVHRGIWVGFWEIKQLFPNLIYFWSQRKCVDKMNYKTEGCIQDSICQSRWKQPSRYNSTVLSKCTGNWPKICVFILKDYKKISFQYWSTAGKTCWNGKITIFVTCVG